MKNEAVSDRLAQDERLRYVINEVKDTITDNKKIVSESHKSAQQHLGSKASASSSLRSMRKS